MHVCIYMYNQISEPIFATYNLICSINHSFHSIDSNTNSTMVINHSAENSKHCYMNE